MVKIKGILQMNYGILKNCQQDGEIKSLIDQWELDQQVVEQQDILDFKKIFTLNKLSEGLANYKDELDQADLQKIIEIFGYLSQNEREKAIYQINQYFQEKGYQDFNDIQLNQLNRIQQEMLVLKALIYYGIDKVKLTSDILWKMCIQIGQPFISKYKLIKQILIYLIKNSNSYYKQCQQMLIKGEYSKCQVNIQKSLIYCFWNPQILIIKSFIDRKNQQFDISLHSLESAYKTIKSIQLQLKNIELVDENDEIIEIIQKFISLKQENELKMQISLCYNEMGQYFFQKGKYTEAYSIFNESLQFNDNDYGIYVNRGDCLKENNLLEDSLKDYLQALELFNSKFQDNNQSQRENIIRIKQEKEQIHQRISVLFHRLGIEYFNQRNYQSSREVLDKAIEFDPENYQLYLNRGKCHQHLGDIQKSMKDYQESLRLNSAQIELQVTVKNMMNEVKSKTRNIIYLEDD